MAFPLTLDPAQVLGSDIQRRERNGRIVYVLETWFIDRHGEKDCVVEELGPADVAVFA